MTSGMGQQPESTDQAVAGPNSTTETPAQCAERERRAAADSRPCGGFMLGGNGNMLGSGN
jgi:hypothetical protein